MCPAGVSDHAVAQQWLQSGGYTFCNSCIAPRMTAPLACWRVWATCAQLQLCQSTVSGHPSIPHGLKTLFLL
ncbi:hypothetical protein DUNSADRAFT_15699 [Dunaliella salina]|uniref:Uncharacterized protein n=1 Tax=Dunaliella salina TaxID=3046 RepID=A0ABQ7G4W9_DUNSA|nr:hypothetical protein DUNSADRAFT_15699 [Dunaliella salina]|eukprot:KAF5829643.1 hypothetical protein DUNSADRAFT_15699 [Dunaliella salina]